MKHIEFPKKWKRILAAFIDFMMMVALFSILYFPLVFPSTFDSTAYSKNSSDSQTLYLDSSMFLRISESKVVSPTNYISYTTIAQVESASFQYEGQTFTVSLINNLRTYYLEKADSYDGTILSESVFKSDVLKIGTSESCLASYEYLDGKSVLTLTSDDKESTAVSFITSLYETTATTISSAKSISSLSDANQKLMLKPILLSIPTLIVASIPFFLIIPLLSKNGQTLGKRWFHIVVLSSRGYELKRIYLLPRWAVYIVFEVVLGIMSFGASFLISYTMFLFAKNHRCLHDFASNSVVADGDNSFWFVDPVEESEYKESHESEKESI